ACCARRAGSSARSLPWPAAAVAFVFLALALGLGRARATSSYSIPLRRPHPEMAAVVTSAPRPNVLLISIDTLRADRLSLYGYDRDTTPFLRRLAHESLVFTHAV